MSMLRNCQSHSSLPGAGLQHVLGEDGPAATSKPAQRKGLTSARKSCKGLSSSQEGYVASESHLLLGNLYKFRKLCFFQQPGSAAAVSPQSSACTCEQSKDQDEPDELAGFPWSSPRYCCSQTALPFHSRRCRCLDFTSAPSCKGEGRGTAGGAIKKCA